METGNSHVQTIECDEEYSFNKAYVDSITEYGNKIEYAVLAYVKEIQKDLGIKLYILNPDKSLFDTNKTWKITKLCNFGLFDRYNDSLLKAVTVKQNDLCDDKQGIYIKNNQK